MIDNKYFAGFVDADGSLGIHIRKRDDGLFSLYPKVQVGQLTFRSSNLEELAKNFNVSVKEKKGTDFSLCDFCGTKARNFIELIKNHLVIKDDLAEYILTIPEVVDATQLKLIKSNIKSLRKKNQPTKNHPSRKWMAGYVDGDGCFSGSVKHNGTLNIKLSIACCSDATAGIRLIQKAFGGTIYKSAGNSTYYEAYLGEAKTKEFYDNFGKHLRIKKDQMLLVRNYVGENKHSMSNGGSPEANREFLKSLATTKYLGRY